MATDINKSTDRIDPPTVVINGKLVDTTTGVYASAANQTIETVDIVISGTSVTNRDPYVFQDDVTITLTPDTKFTSNSYSNRSDTDIVGVTPMGSDNKVGKYAETYYTLNGKDPVRTKANLYTGAFTVKSNKFGSSDNIVLKAKTYVNGKCSEVMKVDFRIARSDGKI